MMDVKSGVMCRYCNKEILENENNRRLGQYLSKDPIAAHFCSDTCSDLFERHGKKSIRDNYVIKGSAQEAMLSSYTDLKKRDAKHKLVDAFEEDAKEQDRLEKAKYDLEQDLTEDVFDDDTI